MFTANGPPTDGTHARPNVTNEEHVQVAVDAIVQRFGSLDFAHNDAGNIGVPPIFSAVQRQGLGKIQNLCLKGVWLGMCAQLPVMMPRWWILMVDIRFFEVRTSTLLTPRGRVQRLAGQIRMVPSIRLWSFRVRTRRANRHPSGVRTSSSS